MILIKNIFHKTQLGTKMSNRIIPIEINFKGLRLGGE